MRKEIADLVFPILQKGLDLRSRLEQGEKVDLTRERTQLCRTLNTLPQRPEFVGDGGQFLGIRYALACWLDDLFIKGLSPGNADSSSEWDSNAVEVELYSRRLRAVNFWHQETLARQVETDVLEVFYLCVLLGFRGDKRDKPDELQEWRQRTKEMLDRNRPKTWVGKPSERTVPWDVTPLEGRKRLRRALLWFCLSLALMVLIVGLVFVFVNNRHR
jgi:type VI secretion system protein ImpK